MNVTSPSSDLEAPKDPGAQKSYTSVTDNEILGKISFILLVEIRALIEPIAKISYVITFNILRIRPPK